jgi:transcriptional regulator with XRE-family HTH domain
MQKIAKKAGRRILRIRTEQELSQQIFSGRLGISQGHLANLEREIRNPSHALLRLIGLEFNINLGWLISGRESG